jgi:hypothetical protein
LGNMGKENLLADELQLTDRVRGTEAHVASGPIVSAVKNERVLQATEDVHDFTVKQPVASSGDNQGGGFAVPFEAWDEYLLAELGWEDVKVVRHERKGERRLGVPGDRRGLFAGPHLFERLAESIEQSTSEPLCPTFPHSWRS